MKRLLIAAFVTTVGATAAAQVVETLVVTPTNLRGWNIADTKPGGAVEFVLDSTAPAGTGALRRFRTQ